MKKSNVELVVSEFNKQEQFELWNIKTSIKNILFNFYNVYQSQQKAIEEESEKILFARWTKEDEPEEFGLISSHKDQYFLTIGAVVMTPTNLKQRNYLISKSTMRQYLDVLIAFKIIKPAKEIYYTSSMLTGLFSVNFKILKRQDFDLFLAQAFYNLRKNLDNLKTKSRRIFYTAMLNFLTDGWDEEDEIKCKYIDVKKEVWTRIEFIQKIAKEAGLLEISELFQTIGWNDKDIVDELLKLLK